MRTAQLVQKVEHGAVVQKIGHGAGVLKVECSAVVQKIECGAGVQEIEDSAGVQNAWPMLTLCGQTSFGLQVARTRSHTPATRSTAFRALARNQDWAFEKRKELQTF